MAKEQVTAVRATSNHLLDNRNLDNSYVWLQIEVKIFLGQAATQDEWG